MSYLRDSAAVTGPVLAFVSITSHFGERLDQRTAAQEKVLVVLTVFIFASICLLNVVV